MLGPLFCLKLKSVQEGYDRRLVTELWFYPDGSRILEVSTKCAPSEAFEVAAETRAFLTSKEIDLGSDQQIEDADRARVLRQELQERSRQGSGPGREEGEEHRSQGAGQGA